jgi:hypothetical protein
MTALKVGRYKEQESCGFWTFIVYFFFGFFDQKSLIQILVLAARIKLRSSKLLLMLRRESSFVESSFLSYLSVANNARLPTFREPLSWPRTAFLAL